MPQRLRVPPEDSHLGECPGPDRAMVKIGAKVRRGSLHEQDFLHGHGCGTGAEVLTLAE